MTKFTEVTDRNGHLNSINIDRIVRVYLVKKGQYDRASVFISLSNGDSMYTNYTTDEEAMVGFRKLTEVLNNG